MKKYLSVNGWQEKFHASGISPENPRPFMLLRWPRQFNVGLFNSACFLYFSGIWEPSAPSTTCSNYSLEPGPPPLKKARMTASVVATPSSLPVPQKTLPRAPSDYCPACVHIFMAGAADRKPKFKSRRPDGLCAQHVKTTFPGDSVATKTPRWPGEDLPAICEPCLSNASAPSAPNNQSFK